MATGNETNVYEALASHLAAMPEIPAAKIAWPNMRFVPDGWHVRVAMLPAATERQSLGNEFGTQRGIFQVSVFWPENAGLRSPLETASAVAAHFNGADISRAGVTVLNRAPPYLAAPLQEPGWIQIPVTIPYMSFTPNP